MPALPVLQSSQLLEAFRRDHARRRLPGGGGEIELSLRPAYLEVLAALGNPQARLPPVFHVAGTNGKGSTCAFLRAMLEAEGYKVHVYTSPHLVRFHERIRVAGVLITEEALVGILQECYRAAPAGALSKFEVETVAAFTAFARQPADFTIVEVGLGGRLDATNVIDQPLASVITRLSYDHRDYLGDSLTAIATEKAGIMRRGVPCFTACQPEAEADEALQRAAAVCGTPLYRGGQAWRVTPMADGFVFEDGGRRLELPLPALPGPHQVDNAGLALAAVGALPQALSASALTRGLRTVSWPARLQRLTAGKLVEQLPDNWELWVDGGHNDSAGAALARQAAVWRDTQPLPLYLLAGMLASKRPAEFLAPLAPFITAARCVTLASDMVLPTPPFAPEALAQQMKLSGIADSAASGSVRAALSDLIRAGRAGGGRILICGSLYLAGEALALNGTVVQ